MKRHTEQTFISEEETEGEEFERSPSNPPDYRGQRGLPFRNRANRHWDAEAHYPHEPGTTEQTTVIVCELKKLDEKTHMYSSTSA